MNCKSVKVFPTFIISSLMIFIVSCANCARIVDSSNRFSPPESVQPTNANVSTSDETPQKPIDTAAITSVSVRAGYRSYFDRDSKCRKSYDELFGNKDGFRSESSACSAEISVGRDGAATKTIILNRYDKNTGRMNATERSVWTAEIGGDEFRAFAEAIAADDFIKNYPPGMQIYTSNFSISVSQGERTETFSGNADDRNPRPISVIELFKELDGKIKWTKIEERKDRRGKTGTSEPKVLPVPDVI